MARYGTKIKPRQRVEILQEKFENDEFPAEAKYFKGCAINYCKELFDCSGSCAAMTVTQWANEYDVYLERGFPY